MTGQRVKGPLVTQAGRSAISVGAAATLPASIVATDLRMLQASIAVIAATVHGMFPALIRAIAAAVRETHPALIPAVPTGTSRVPVSGRTNLPSGQTNPLRVNHSDAPSNRTVSRTSIISRIAETAIAASLRAATRLRRSRPISVTIIVPVSIDRTPRRTVRIILPALTVRTSIGPIRIWETIHRISRPIIISRTRTEIRSIGCAATISTSITASRTSEIIRRRQIIPSHGTTILAATIINRTTVRTCETIR